MYYFGVNDNKGLGHYLWTQDAKRVDIGGPIQIDRDKKAIPWVISELDGGLAPDDPSQQHGKALLHHKDGWTALAFWDRTGDRRSGSNSVFLEQGVLTFEEILKIAEKQFSEITKRFNFILTCTDQ